MTNLRSIVDSVGALQLGVFPRTSDTTTFKENDDVVIRRKTHRSGPNTSEVIVGRILAVGDETAEVSINKQHGVTQRVRVNLNDLSPVTDSFRRQSVQFNTSHRRRA